MGNSDSKLGCQLYRAAHPFQRKKKRRAAARLSIWCNRVLVNGSTTNSECESTIPSPGNSRKSRLEVVIRIGNSFASIWRQVVVVGE